MLERSFNDSSSTNLKMSQIKSLYFVLYKQLLISKGRGILQLSSEIYYSFLADKAMNRKRKLLQNPWEVNTSFMIALNASPCVRWNLTARLQQLLGTSFLKSMLCTTSVNYYQEPDRRPSGSSRSLQVKLWLKPPTKSTHSTTCSSVKPAPGCFWVTLSLMLGAGSKTAPGTETTFMSVMPQCLTATPNHLNTG